MIDSYNRTIDYLRVSLTDRCDLRCVYCMPPEGVKKLRHSDILRIEEIVRIVRILAKNGVRRVKLTGGEPLLRRGICDAVRMIRAVPGIEEVTLTTNGVLLSSMLDDLLCAGICAVNISLDTLDPDKYRAITRTGSIDRVLRSLNACLQKGDRIRTSINCVPMTDAEDIRRLAALAKDHDLNVRFIEKMPIGVSDTDCPDRNLEDLIPSGTVFPGGDGIHYCDEQQVRAILEESFGPLTPYSGHVGNGPAEYYTLRGFRGRIGFIAPLTHCFCRKCSRLRLTSTGYLKTCLYYGDGADLKPLLAGSDEQIESAILDAVRRKRKAHHFGQSGDGNSDARSMSMIGG